MTIEIIIKIICAILWGIAMVLNFMHGDTFLGILNAILALIWAFEAIMEIKEDEE